MWSVDPRRGDFNEIVLSSSRRMSKAFLSPPLWSTSNATDSTIGEATVLGFFGVGLILEYELAYHSHVRLLPISLRVLSKVTGTLMTESRILRHLKIQNVYFTLEYLRFCFHIIGRFVIRSPRQRQNWRFTLRMFVNKINGIIFFFVIVYLWLVTIVLLTRISEKLRKLEYFSNVKMRKYRLCCNI